MSDDEQPSDAYASQDVSALVEQSVRRGLDTSAPAMLLRGMLREADAVAERQREGEAVSVRLPLTVVLPPLEWLCAPAQLSEMEPVTLDDAKPLAEAAGEGLH